MARKGEHLSKEIRRRMSEAQRGVPKSREHIAKVVAARNRWFKTKEGKNAAVQIGKRVAVTKRARWQELADSYGLEYHFFKKVRRYFFHHRLNARARGVSFRLTFHEWITLWIKSGHLYERGRFGYQYVMARFGDHGPYAIWNVEIVPGSQNTSDAHRNRSP